MVHQDEQDLPGGAGGQRPAITLGTGTASAVIAASRALTNA
ncbi:hypothetical protein [Dactylosporangium darangshiense]